MSKAMRFTVLLVAVMCMFALAASSAYAYSGFYVPCENCHASRSGATVTATVGTITGNNAAVDIATTGATEWAVFVGYSRVATGSGSATVNLPIYTTYSVYAVSGTPTSGTYAKTSVTPGGAWTVLATPDTTAPQSSATVAANYNNSATIEISATDVAGAEGPAWGIGYIYYSVDGGNARVTPVGEGGKAYAVVAPNTAGVSNHTIEYWAQDRAGNDEDPANSASFTITRAAAAPSAATASPSVLGVNGTSAWSYKDLADTWAKYEGGYAAYGGVSGWYADPHGGYDTATNKCKVCHAVHRAEGAYYLLRADSQDDACDYCHVGGSAHSSKVVYDNGGTGTATGHTIGASTYIPDSTVAQWTETVTLTTVDENGDPITEDINVRAYDEQKNDMYRFARHHGHSLATGGARRNYVPVGPLALRCMNCHQVHNASFQTWQSISYNAMDNTGAYTGAATGAYKLLKQSPSGSFYGAKDSYGQIALTHVSIVPESTLTAGVNFDSVRSATATAPGPLSLVRTGANAGTMAMARPVWVAQTFNFEQDAAEAVAAGEVPEKNFRSSVNNAALSVWCADCHNLNIGATFETAEEFGFKAHTERTHPAPYTGAHSGPGQCYSCHRADLPRINTGDSCSQCHYGTGNYRENRMVAGAEFVASDFPHSGDGSYKMLGNYSITVDGTDAGRTTPAAATISADNLDAVCIRCHGGIGTYH